MQVFRRAPLALLALLAALAILTGCGGDSGQSGSGSAVEREAYDRRAEAICERGRLRALSFQGRPGAGEAPRGALNRAVTRNMLPVLGDVARQLRALDAPADGEAAVQDFVEALERGVDAARGLRLPTLENVERKLGPAGARAERLKLEACVYG